MIIWTWIASNFLALIVGAIVGWNLRILIG
jgi:hypothetical protein